ncbi:type II toxin-antitoxin system VapC family toxin [Candidatus Bathyarchaeota archaeon]|nr:type II toxin-antitoxin system VapC family toxin [Candidatus Bathyarchaeota archaeon]
MKLERSGLRKLSGTEVLLDANIFLEAELAEIHGPACKQLLEKLRDGEIKAAITDFHVDSIVIVMEKYGKRWSEISLFLASLLRYRGLKVYPLSLVSRIKATSFMKEYGLNFDDALAVQALKELSTNIIVSYDEDFNSIEWIKRQTPEELL